MINELLDTEKNYVDVLSKLKKNFMRPLANQMKTQDHETVFYKINVDVFYWIVLFSFKIMFLGIA